MKRYNRTNIDLQSITQN